METQTQICTLRGSVTSVTCICTYHINAYPYSFHNQLETVHLNGTVTHRVDFLVHHLLEYEKDAFFRYKSARQLPPATNRRAIEEQNRHQRGLEIPSKMVQVQI